LTIGAVFRLWPSVRWPGKKTVEAKTIAPKIKDFPIWLIKNSLLLGNFYFDKYSPARIFVKSPKNEAISEPRALKNALNKGFFGFWPKKAIIRR
jgi:hypothetical protein